MKTKRPPRRSVSPFGIFTPAHARSFGGLIEAIQDLKDIPQNDDEAAALELLKNSPVRLEQMAEAASNDAPQLSLLCGDLLRYDAIFRRWFVHEAVFSAMEELFLKKIGSFLIFHHDKTACENMGWSDEFRDDVLFSKERDTLIGRFFYPVTESAPGEFSGFLDRWMGSGELDRLLHFLDFLVGATNPTFDHFLVYSQPSIQRILSNKSALREILKETEPVLKKLGTATWEARLRQILGL